MSTDRIEKKIVLRASPSRVWRALTDAREFGAWFGARLDGAVFAPGAKVAGQIASPGYESWKLEIAVERMEPERLFSYRWHPYPEPGKDYSAEPTTLVEFRLAKIEGGTELTVVESGFDRIPASRRDKAFRMHEDGWVQQVQNVSRHVSA